MHLLYLMEVGGGVRTLAHQVAVLSPCCLSGAVKPGHVLPTCVPRGWHKDPVSVGERELMVVFQVVGTKALDPPQGCAGTDPRHQLDPLGVSWVCVPCGLGPR